VVIALPFLPYLYFTSVPEMVWVLLIGLWGMRALCGAACLSAAASLLC
jgi:hypothetical protein